MKREAALAGAYGAFLVVLGAAGALAPGGLNWGFHALGFFSRSAALLFVVAGAGIIAIGMTGAGETIVHRTAGFLSRRPWAFLLAAAAAFVTAALVFRIAVPLLGDSYLIVNNYQNTLRGDHALNTYSEPLAMFYFFGVLKLLGAAEQADILRGFFIGDLLLGLGFIVNVYLTARRLFAEPLEQVLFFGFLVCTSALQLFFGYVESYPVVLYCLSLFVLAVAYCEKGTLPFAVVALTFLLQVAVHFLNILLFPLLLALAYREYRERGPQGLVIAAGVTVAVVASAVFFLGGELVRFMPRFSHVHYLSIMGAGDEFQAYNLFSAFHLLDLANLALLVMPFGLFLLTMALFSDGWRSLVARGTPAFALASVCFLGFLLVVKYDLGTAKDWDIAATFAFPFAVFVGRSLLVQPSPQRVRAFFLAIALALLTAVPYFSLNASVEPNIARYRSLLDDRVMSRESYYVALNHLSKYYFTLGDGKSINELWERYIARYPSDWRGYRGLIKSLVQLGDPDDPRIRETFTTWMAKDPDKKTMRADYLQYGYSMSQRGFAKGDATGVLRLNRDIVAFDSTIAPAWNNIGLALRAQGEYRQAVDAYQRAVNLDPRFAAAQINLGNAYDDLGNTAEAITWYERSLMIDPGSPGAQYNLGVARLKLHDTAGAVAALREAARLGEPEAQELLRQRGLSW